MNHKEPKAPSLGMLERLQNAIVSRDFPPEVVDDNDDDNDDLLRAGMDPRCQIPPKPPPKPPVIIPKPEGHEYTQHFKYRHIDKDPCGTYDIIELDTAENLTKMLAPGASGGNELEPPKNGGGSGVSNDLDHVIHFKYRNVDKSWCGELDIQEGEQIEVRKTILPGMPREPPPPPAPQGPCSPPKDEGPCKRLNSGMETAQKCDSPTWNVQKSYNSDLGYPSDNVNTAYPLSYSGLDSFSNNDSCPSICKSRNTFQLRAGMDQGNQNVNIQVNDMFKVSRKDKGPVKQEKDMAISRLQISGINTYGPSTIIKESSRKKGA